MKPIARIEHCLQEAIGSTAVDGGPPRLAAAMRHAVFPGGARIRPRLCLSVAAACGDDAPSCTNAAAAAIELLHCASLAHDDLPCFDNAAVRRGQPSVHRAFGERLAVLAGDALIVLAFEVVARGAASWPARASALLLAVARGVGAPAGIAAGQAWECEPRVALADYQQAKTGALFVAATTCGALSAGADPAPWRALGERLGEAYQVADDIRDVLGDPALLGKPTGRDADLGRPSAAEALGLAGAIRHFADLMEGAIRSVPACHGAAQFRTLLNLEAERLLPTELTRQAA